MNRLANKVAFITGGSAGIGQATARMFAREGAAVAIADIDVQGGESTAESIRAAGGRALFVATDVTSDDSVKQAIQSTAAHFGRLNVLFNCAGGPLAADNIVTEVDLAVWDHTTSVDLKGTVLVCRHGIPELIKDGGGTVVNMSSGAALRGGGNGHIYGLAKGAILALTRALAGAYVHQNVRSNAICAGRIATARVIKKFGLDGQPAETFDLQNSTAWAKDYPFWMGKPDDIAHIAVFLASDESRMITGASIAADGGRSAY